MNIKKRENENRLISKFYRHGKNPNIKYKKCKFLINVVGGEGVVSGDNIRKLPHPLKRQNIKNRIKY